MSTPAENYAAAWYPDEHAPGQERYYDGQAWTEQRRPAQALELAPAPEDVRTSRLAIASLVTAVLGLGLVAVVLGAFALRAINRATPSGSLTGRGLALAGIIVGVIWGFIVVILMAVAIPTFMVQKENAMGQVGRANVVQLRNAVESCGAQNTDGSYSGCAGGRLVEEEPALESLLDRGCAAAGGGCVELAEGDLGYTVAARTSVKPSALFTEEHAPDGAVSRTCEPAGVAGCPASGSW